MCVCVCVCVMYMYASIIKELKLAVVGSEVVGLLPLAAILSAADYYIQRDDLFILHERQKVRLAVERLGLNSVAEFRAEEKIIE